MYAKLPEYDRETGYQPPSVFMCHQQDGHLCAGWVGCHDMVESLGVRIGAATGQLSPDDLDAILKYESPVELFATGQEAAEHGLAAISNPPVASIRMIQRLERKQNRR